MYPIIFIGLCAALQWGNPPLETQSQNASIAVPAVSQNIEKTSKPALTHSVYDSWKSVDQVNITSDGLFGVGTVREQEGDSQTYLWNFKDKQPNAQIFQRAVNPKFTKDGKFLIYELKPAFVVSRQARREKKKPEEMPKDTLIIKSLAQTGAVEYSFPDFKSYDVAEEGGDAVAILVNVKKATKSEPQAKQPRPARAGVGKTHTDMVILNLTSGQMDTIKNVSKMNFNYNGLRLGFTVNATEKDSLTVNGVFVLHTDSGKIDTLLTGDSRYSYETPVFSEDMSRAAFVALTDTNSKKAELSCLYQSINGAPAAVIVDANTKGVPDNWVIADKGTLYYSPSGKRLFLACAPAPLQKDTTLIEDEQAKLDIWHWADEQLQTVQTRRGRIANESYTAVVNPDNAQSIRMLASDQEPYIVSILRGESPWAYASNDKAYRIESQWNSNRNRDLYLINIETGERKCLSKAEYISGTTVSPSGRYIAWFLPGTKQWYSLDLNTGEEKCLTESLSEPLWDMDVDTPTIPRAYGSGGWIGYDQIKAMREGRKLSAKQKATEYLLIFDQYDIWQLDPSGKNPPVNITLGQGRKNCITMRNARLTAGGRGRMGMGAPEAWEPGKPITIQAFNNITKEYGLYTLNKGKLQCVVMEGHSFPQVVKAKEAERMIFVQANFEEGSDVWTSNDNMLTRTRLTDINPQQKDYNWGTVELVHWTAPEWITSEGQVVPAKELDGLLYKPENFDPSRKYPMLIYFYEKNSETLYNYKAPAPSRSTINIPFFISNEYLVFVPDIVYVDGHPGQCAMHCIMPGVDMLCQNSWVDEANMAIQGQSWGGYQVAYMVTQTNRFKAAGAGAPVSNMTSAYGGIRWESGVVRQGQYESGQSRIGKDLWEGFDLYVENSPVFFARNVETPLLIMHNDNDGAVPWTQGIEYFTALRRAGKKVWMLQYNDESHNLSQRKNAKDLSIRLEQFFNHFLKGAPAPVWIKDGVPANKKGYDWGLGF